MTGNYLHNHPQFRSLLNIVAEEEDILPALVEKDYFPPGGCPHPAFHNHNLSIMSDYLKLILQISKISFYFVFKSTFYERATTVTGRIATHKKNNGKEQPLYKP